MSRITKWKLEKTKVKVVFRLQFHATHIPQTGWEKLFISFIPAESGKTTAKTSKANVRNGTCKWADPIYETTRLLQDAKSKQYDEKLYKLVVAMVTVQLLTSKTGFREFEQQRELREKGWQMGTDLNRHDESGTGKVSSSEETANDQMDKVNTRVRFRPESKDLPSLEEEVGLNEEYTESNVGFDGSSNTSESLYAEKHDTSSAHEIDSLKSTISGDFNGLPHCQSPQTVKGDPSDHRILAQGSSDWVQGWGSDYSMDNDLAIAYEENSRLRVSLEVAESSIFELKLEISSLQSHADEIGVESLKFSHQLSAEIASGEELAKEVLLLKSECSKFKDDFEQLKHLKLSSQFTSRESSHTKQDHLLQGIQLRWLKGLFIVEGRIRELQNKAYLGFRERDFSFLHSDLEGMLNILQDLKQGTEESLSRPIMIPSERTNVEKIKDMNLHKNEQFVPGTGFDVDLYQPESMLHYVSIPSLVSQEPESTVATDVMKGKTFELLRQLDEAKVERENYARKMDQMECYYEALIQELEENQKQMLGELQNLRNEHSTCLYTISTNKAEMDSLRQDMNEQILKFSEERRDLDSLNKELERRAITSEAALKRARLNYSIAADQLQKDLELLSFQVLSMFETNKNLIKQAFSETSETVFEGYPDTLQNPEKSDAAKLGRCQNQNVGLKKQLLGGDFLLEDLKKSLHLQEGLYQKVEVELCEMHSANLYLDVFSKTLQETLLEATIDNRLKKERMDEFAQQLELSTESRDLLMARLQTAMDDVHTLNEYKASCNAKCSDMLLQNQILEAKLESVFKENCFLTQKITEWEALMMEYRSYESKYEACSAEKSELEKLLKLETLENSNVQDEMFLLKEELRTLKAGFDELAISKEDLQKIISFLRDKLGTLLTSYDEQFSGLSLLTNSECQALDFEDFKVIIMQLEEIQQNACCKILQLIEEKKDLKDEKDMAEVSLSTARSEILGMKQKFKHSIQDMVTKLDVSNALVEKLQLELESVANKFHMSLEVEEKYALQNKELFTDLALVEAELQKLYSKNSDLAREIVGLGTVAEELGRNKLTIAELIQEKLGLIMSLQDKTEESIKLASELDNLKESLRCVHDELQVERGFRDKLECTVSGLTSQLNEKHDKLLYFDQQNAELLHFRQLASDLELEKSGVFHLLLQQEECLGKVREESSCLTGLKSQLSEMHEHLIAADVKISFIRTQCEILIEDLVQQLQSSDGHHRELQKKHLNVEAILNCCLANEAHYIDENAKLVTTLESLRSDLEASVSQNRVFSDSNNVIMAQLEEYRKRSATLEVSFSEDNNRHALEVEQLKHMLVNAEEEIGNLIVSKEELEIIVIVLTTKLHEQHARITLLEEYNDELMMLQDRCNELTRRLSEQILKTEEFKNLSVHLKELKDKADAECLMARQRKEPEGPSFAMQESLRIAFIKEHYETRLQELRQQLSISKKHGEEMLWKLQDAIDETENRKKSEASHLKRNEELSLKILELEADLQSVISEKREKIKAYDRIKAELECTLLSLECCKEEKEKLEVSLQECKEEKSKIAVELTLIEGQLENSTSLTHIQKEENGGLGRVSHIPGDYTIGKSYQEYPMAGTSNLERSPSDVCGSTGNLLTEYLDENCLVDSDEVQDASSIPTGEGEHSTAPMNVQPIQDVLVSKGVHGVPEHACLDQGDLKSSIEHLHEELERMKNENSLLPQTNFAPKFQDLQGELMQLHEANKELESIFPLFNEFSGCGNALERVLALEIELAEALRAKKKSSIHFQSSFLKQHSDEEAVFKSFRYINELIKDMLEVKGKYAAVETELKEMHDRYSQLSLQFAEVEGERQKLMMTLKNVRTSKKRLHLSRSSSAAIVDHPL